MALRLGAKERFISPVPALPGRQLRHVVDDGGYWASFLRSAHEAESSVKGVMSKGSGALFHCVADFVREKEGCSGRCALSRRAQFYHVTCRRDRREDFFRDDGGPGDEAGHSDRNGGAHGMESSCLGLDE